MKNIITVIASLVFSTLFYKQNIGLNLLLFTILSIIVLTANNYTKFLKQKTIALSIVYILTGIMVFVYDSNLSIITNIISFFTLVGCVSEHKSSIYIKWINGLYSTIVSSFSRYFDTLNSETKKVKKQKIDYKYWVKIIGIPLIASIIFVSLYRNGNPKFDALISNIDLSFINFQWILLAGLGYYLFHNISNPIQIEPVTVNDISSGDELQSSNLKKESVIKLENEKQLGIVLLFVLNLLIILFLTTDLIYLSEIKSMNSSELSKQVHNGINALIASIFLAIGIIIYFFRGNLNFLKNNRNLKNLAHSWILLNSILVLITAFKNYEYISSFGFTYKRIGVLIYLFLTLVGLTTTFIKVYKIKNISYLFRKNLQIAFTILVISATINWDYLITYYNVEMAEQTDTQYLLELSNNNTFLLNKYLENNTLHSDYNSEIRKKYDNYIFDLRKNTWQEMKFDNFKIEN